MMEKQQKHDPFNRPTPSNNNVPCRAREYIDPSQSEPLLGVILLDQRQFTQQDHAAIMLQKTPDRYDVL